MLFVVNLCLFALSCSDAPVDKRSVPNVCPKRQICIATPLTSASGQGYPCVEPNGKKLLVTAEKEAAADVETKSDSRRLKR